MDITTARLRLRPFTTDDLADFYDIQHNEQVNRFVPWFAPQSLIEADAMLHRQYLDNHDGYHLAVCLRSDNRPFGYINVDGTGAHDLGYGMLPAFWGHGYMTEAGTALIANLPASIPFITATHDVLNPKSGAVMQRLGMAYQYTYLEQWQPKDIPVNFRLYLRNLDGNKQREFPKYWDESAQHWVEADMMND